MATARAALTATDISTLVNGASADERAAAAHKLCRRIDERLTAEEREAAAEVMRVLAADAAEVVRRALAVTLRRSPFLPRDVALMLAADVEAVATPVLNFSPAFTDEDLAEIVRSTGAAKQLAVAQRAELAPVVTSAIAECAGQEALSAACANDNAAFSEGGLTTALDRFGGAEAVTTALAYRKVLPLAITERLVDLVSDSVRQHLMDRHRLTPETALHIALGARERATLDLVEQAGRAHDMAAFVAHLHKSLRLTPSLILRALAHGNMPFFEHSMASLANARHDRAWMLIHDAGPLGLRALYERTGLPQRLFSAFRVGVDTFHQLQQEGGMFTVADLQERMLQRFLTQPTNVSREDVDYLLDRMDHADAPEEKRAA